MEVAGAKTSSSARLDFHSFGLTLLTWVSFFILIRPGLEAPLWQIIIFATGAVVFSTLALHFLGYFDVLRYLSGRKGIHLVLVALPLGGMLQHALMHGLFDVFVCSLGLIISGSMLLGLIVFGGYALLSTVPSEQRRRKKVVLDLLPNESATIIGDFVAAGYDSQVEFLGAHDLREALLSGQGRDINLIIISRSAVTQFDEEALLVRAHLAGIPIIDYRAISTRLTGRIRLAENDLWTFLLLATRQTRIRRAVLASKLVLEPLLALALAAFFAPIMLTVAILIRCTSKGPILYRQRRTGYHGKNFMLVKFRSMYTDSEQDGPRWASDNDNRVTPVGKLLRRTRLDELPQLWNVIKGEMGFFGPRPERPEIYQKLREEIPLFHLRTIVRPGITGWAQVCAGYAASVEESKTKLEFDLYYIQHMSLRLDIVILWKTFLVALFGSTMPQRSFMIDLPQHGNELAGNELAKVQSGTH